MHLAEVLARIDKRLAATKLKDATASKLAGKTDAIRNMRRAVESGEGRQGVSTATINALAPVLGTTAIWLFAGAGPEDPTKPEAQDELSPITKATRAIWVGFVEAGTWGEVSDFTDLPPDEIPVVYAEPDPEFPGVQMLSATVRGDSMDNLQPDPLPPGTIVTGPDFEGLRGRVPLRPGMIVVVQRAKDGGHKVERSLKQLEIFDDRFEYHPRSKSKHEVIVQPFKHDADDGVEVKILFLVTNVSRRLRY